MKKTVIDELIEECEANSFDIELQNGIKLIVVGMDELKEILNDKKETHKQQIIKAYNRGIKVGFNNLFEDAEDYYKETYLNEL